MARVDGISTDCDSRRQVFEPVGRHDRRHGTRLVVDRPRQQDEP